MNSNPTLKKCLVIGAINVDIIGQVDFYCKNDEAVEVKCLNIVPGGHASNCATSMSKLGADVRLLGCVGTDEFSRIALSGLRDHGIDTKFIVQTKEIHTGIVFIPVLPDGDKALYVARGANEYLSEKDVRLAVSDCEIVIVFDPPLDLLPVIAETVYSKNTIFAPGGLVSAVPKPMLAPLLQAADVLVVNKPESELMTGLSNPKLAAIELATEWTLNAIVTIGSGGCWVSQPGQSAYHCPSFAVEVVDTTGAGDAFVGGFAVAMSSSQPLLSAVVTGCASGALTTRSLGAQAANLSLAEVNKLMATDNRIDPY